MRLNRQIILLFFLSSIVNLSSRYRQAIVKVSSIVKPKDPSSTGPKVKRSKGPRVQRSSQGQQQDQTSPADPCRNQDQEPGPKVYIYGMQQPTKK